MAHKKVYMIRHSQTPGNAEKRYIGGRTDEELSEVGVKMARNAHARLLSIIPEKVDRICVSPMKRAIQTANILFDDPKLHKIENLREMDFGFFEGKNYQELNGNEIYQKWIDSNGTMEIPDSEGREVFFQRSFEGLCEALGDSRTDEIIAIVCHGGNIMAVLSRLTGKDYYDFMTANLGGYCLELETDDEGIHIITYNKLDSGDNS